MRSLAVFFFPVMLWAQVQVTTPTQPPPADPGFDGLWVQAPKPVDDALRARIAIFYNAHKDGKFRLADGVVHEDSKDVFFGAEKMRCRGWSIVKINYEENYTRARVVVDLDTDYTFLGFGKMPVHIPLNSSWKFDNGEWWWYVVVNKCQPGPLGTMCKGADTDPTGDAISKMFDANAVTPEKLRAMLILDKKEVTLSSHEPSQETVTFTNKFVGPITLNVSNDDMPGLGVVIDKATIQPGESARLSISYRPSTRVKKPDVRAWVYADQISTNFQIQIHFANPPNNEPVPGTYLPAPVKSVAPQSR